MVKGGKAVMERFQMNSNSSKRRMIWLALVLGSFAAIGPLSLDMYLPGLPSLADDLNSSTSLAQLSLTACMLGLAVGQIYLGPLSDSKGRRMPLILSLAVYSASSLACAFVPSVEMLLLMRFIQGVSGAGGIVISKAIVRDLFSGTELTKFFSMLMLVNGAAPILAPVFGGQLLQFTSWRGVFIVLCILSMMMIAAAFWGLAESLPKELRNEGSIANTFRTFSRLAKDRIFIGFAFSQGFVSAAMFAYISGSPFVLQNLYGVSAQMFSLIFAINGVGIILASQVTGRLAGKVKEGVLLVFGLYMAMTGGMILLTGILLQAGLIIILIGLFLSVASVGIVGTTSFALAMENQRSHAGSAAALLGLIPFILGAIVAPLVGLGGEDSPLPMGMVIVGSQIIAILSYFIVARPMLKKGKSNEKA